MQELDPHLTTWHITFGTYGTRLHGDYRATVDKRHNELGTSFLGENEARKSSEEKRMRFPPVILTAEQRSFLQNIAPALCDRGGWRYRICAAGPDHFHILLDIDPKIHGELVRKLLKRWCTQDLNQHWPLPKGASWWAEEGSNKAIHEEKYLNNAYNYIAGQRLEI
jgi:REP element-mobilizing transposase RayT